MGVVDLISFSTISFKSSIFSAWFKNCSPNIELTNDSAIAMNRSGLIAFTNKSFLRWSAISAKSSSLLSLFLHAFINCSGTQASG
ncbi:hypothetical protein BpHYR1_016973 [Brachionus plicatilis]|uniref:Uncharacterized protein n=1 Tax=Brachionus plicatilis TaxID=10195 RepID=A0A3M7S941_BRAPC|nr:hypothetical protein BpHYR1_016973 [Brachionus plicatilis]